MRNESTIRHVAVGLIKTIHTAIFAVVSTSVLYVFWAGVRGRPSRLAGWASGIVVVEAAVFAGNGLRCPLTTLTENLGAEHGQVTDIFLPRWFADRIPQIYTPPFLIGVLGLLWHQRHAKLASRTQ